MRVSRVSLTITALLFAACGQDRARPFGNGASASIGDGCRVESSARLRVSDKENQRALIVG